MRRIHATCIAIDGRGVLLRGASGAGKSDLALRLIDEGAHLVADDQVELRAADGRLTAAAPPAIAGRIEVRGIGIVAMSCLADLVRSPDVERLPEPRVCRIEGIDVPVIALAPFEASATAKIRLAVRRPLR